MPLVISPLFVALLVVIQFGLTAFVGAYRVKSGIDFLDGGDVTMTRRMRAHGNFTETIPIALIAMILAELSGAPAMLLWGGGAALVLGRLIHVHAIVTRGMAPGRGIGMAMTFLAMFCFAGFLAWHFWGAGAAV